MRSAVALLLLDGLTSSEITPLEIVRTRRLNADQVEITFYGTSFTRILIYVGTDVVFDSDDAGDAATIQTDTDGNTRVTITSLEDGLGAPPSNGQIPATAVDQVLSTQSEPTEFTIAGLVLGGNTRNGRIRRIARINRI